MGFQGRYVTTMFGGKPLEGVKDVNISREPIDIGSDEDGWQTLTESEKSSAVSFNHDDLAIPHSVEFNGFIECPDGKKLKLKGMNLSNCETPFKYIFDCKSILIKRVMETKGKQPRTVAVWRKL
jgi:hypothetical protein